MKFLIALMLLVPTLTFAQSRITAEEGSAGMGAKVIPLGQWNGQAPTLESLDEFKSIKTPSKFGLTESIQWAAKLAINPSVSEEIVLVYSYSTDEVCNSEVTAADAGDQNPVLAAFAESFGEDLYPGALYISFDGDSEDDAVVRWYDSLTAACESPDTYSDVHLSEVSLASVHESLLQYDLNEAYVTTVPLWGVDAVGKHWAVCDTSNLSDSADSACRMRLRSSSFTRHRMILDDPS